MDPLHSLETAIATDWPSERWRDLTVLVAVSGGADSVALLRALQRMRAANDGGHGRLIVAHFNHRWRGLESDMDAAFVRSLANEFSLNVLVGRARPHLAGNSAKTYRKRDEDTGRRRRYSFLRDVAARVGARYVVTAHTADDQVETVLQRVLRGTGVSGLAGIQRVRPLSAAATLIRPMLGIARSDVLKYLDDIQQSYREDSSNSELRYARNRIRHELLPIARELYPGTEAAIQRLARQAGEVENLLARQVELLLEAAVTEQSRGRLLLRTSALNGLAPYLLREFFRHLWRRQDWPCRGMGFDQWTAVAQLATRAVGAAGSEQCNLPGEVRAKKQGEWLTLTRPVL